MSGELPATPGSANVRVASAHALPPASVADSTHGPDWRFTETPARKPWPDALSLGCRSVKRSSLYAMPPPTNQSPASATWPPPCHDTNRRT